VSFSGASGLKGTDRCRAGAMKRDARVGDGPSPCGMPNGRSNFPSESCPKK
jgi:hypothetical protein